MKAEFSSLLFYCVHCDTQDEGTFDDIENGVCPDCLDCSEPTTIRIESGTRHTEHRDYYAQPADFDPFRNAREIVFTCPSND